MTINLHVHPVAFMSPGFARAYLVTMRPYLLFVSGITGIAGLAMGPALPLALTLLLAAVFFLSYGFGQALTDCFQVDTDALSAPYRPLVRGEVRRGEVMAVSLIGLLGSGAIVSVFHPLNLALSVIIVAGLATYTWFKRRWWGGPLWNAWIVAALAMLAWLSTWGGSPRPAVGLGHLGVLAVVFFGYANFVLTGYWKDISADRATGYRTLPVVAGTSVSSWVSHGLAALELGGVALAVLALAPAAVPQDVVWSATFLVPGAGLAVRGQSKLPKVAEATADLAIAPVVHAYILLLAGVAVLVRPAWTPALWLFFACWLLALKLRPMRSQI